MTPATKADSAAWRPAGTLKTGMRLKSSAGTWVQITSIKTWTARQKVHNLTVDDLHTYHVTAGTAAVLVHNAGGRGSCTINGGKYGHMKVVGEQEINHMPAKFATKGKISTHSGPSIRMDKADHRDVMSTGSSHEARAWQAEQRALVNDGRIDEAIQMDINDITSRFPGKYEDVIVEMFDSLASNKAYQKLRAVPSQMHVQMALF